jgi:hypothetical protein
MPNLASTRRNVADKDHFQATLMRSRLFYLYAARLSAAESAPLGCGIIDAL